MNHRDAMSFRRFLRQARAALGHRAKETILLWSIYIAGILALGAFVVVRSEVLMLEATGHAFDDGDLYRFGKVLDFKSKIAPPAEYEPEPVDPDDASVFMIGDSFMDESRGFSPFAKLLADGMGTPIYGVESGGSPENFNLMYFFRSTHITNGKKRTVLLERVERYIVEDFAEPMDQEPDISGTSPRLTSWWQPVKERWFTNAEKNYEYLLQGNAFTWPLLERWNTALFHLLGRMSEKTPRYSLEPPFLFYHEETDSSSKTSFYSPHPDTLIDAIVDNLEMMSDGLASQYNTAVVFMPIPNSYTLYHRFVNNDPYDDFLPRLCDEAERRGLRVVRLYERFATSAEVLYLPTDSHWNETGMRMALGEALSGLKGK